VADPFLEVPGEPVGGVVDLALAREEDEDVAVALPQELLAGVDDPGDEVLLLAAARLPRGAGRRRPLAGAGVLALVRRQRAVAGLDRVGAAGDLDDRCRARQDLGDVLRRSA